MNILKSIQYFLVWAKVVKHEGKTANGQYITTGINRKNPLSYVALLIACLVMGVIAFFKESIDAWRSGW